ncbi:transposase family protein [Streptomyces sp. F-1]|uniref:transposase family protein n=1 Tax=Streptomyces sp. F-1 TaxID=463642 RepID=UPI0023D7F6B2|nr:transposase family protein [Streptomyces sp. F-1]
MASPTGRPRGPPTGGEPAAIRGERVLAAVITRRKTAPARSPSPIPAGLGRLATGRPAEPGEHPLLDRLATVPDPRRAKGRRHPLAFVLALAACAVLAGAKSLTAISSRPDPERFIYLNLLAR